MDVIKTAIDGVVIIEPRVFKDARGYFFESFSQREFEEKVHKINFVQDNESKSGYGVLRGLHFQKPPYAQSKLVRVIKGAVLDVAVDIRKGSPTFSCTGSSDCGRLMTKKGNYMADRFDIGDIITMKKPHPCGSKEWEVLRVGADFRLKCVGCGHQIMVARKLVEKNTRQIVKRT